MYTPCLIQEVCRSEATPFCQVSCTLVVSAPSLHRCDWLYVDLLYSFVLCYSQGTGRFFVLNLWIPEHSSDCLKSETTVLLTTLVSVSLMILSSPASNFAMQLNGKCSYILACASLVLRFVKFVKIFRDGNIYMMPNSSIQFNGCTIAFGISPHIGLSECKWTARKVTDHDRWGWKVPSREGQRPHGEQGG